jgi:hypothetical protein
MGCTEIVLRVPDLNGIAVVLTGDEPIRRTITQPSWTTWLIFRHHWIERGGLDDSPCLERGPIKKVILNIVT